MSAALGFEGIEDTAELTKALPYADNPVYAECAGTWYGLVAAEEATKDGETVTVLRLQELAP